MTAHPRENEDIPYDDVDRLGDTVYFDGSDDSDTIDILSDCRELQCQTRYQLQERIGQGGMGVVYRALDRDLQREVAVKILKPKYATEPTVVHRFLNEAYIKSSLQHPGIVPVFGIGQLEDGRPYYTMKLITGHSLSFELTRAAPSDRATLLAAFTQCCQTMAYAHSQGVVHLDLKPSNIMLGDFGQVRVIDWGLSRRMSPSGNNTTIDPRGSLDTVLERRKTIRGTPEYMAPEQARGERVDTRTDVFSLGAVLCKILTGQPLYVGSENNELLRQAMQGNIGGAMQRLHEAQPELWLSQLITRCLEPNPDDRPRDAQEVAASLARLQQFSLELFESDMARFWELSPDLFCIADLDGYFRQVNSNFMRVLGYTQHELLCQPFINFVHPDDWDSTIAQMIKLNKGQDVIRFRNRYRTSSGEIIQLEWTAKSVPDEKLIFAVARSINDHSDAVDNQTT